MGSSVQDSVLGSVLRPTPPKGSQVTSGPLYTRASSATAAPVANIHPVDSLLVRTPPSFRYSAPNLLQSLPKRGPNASILASSTLIVARLCTRYLTRPTPPQNRTVSACLRSLHPQHAQPTTSARILRSLGTSRIARPPSVSTITRSFSTAFGTRTTATPAAGTAFHHGMHHWGQLAEGSEACLRRVNQLWQQTYRIIPISPWHSLSTLWSSAVGRLPMYQFSGHLQVAVINAINLMGQQLPRLIGVFIAELMRNRWASAEAFDPHYLQLPPSLGRPPPLPWWKALLEELVDATINLSRLAYLLLLFTPVVITAPLAIYLDFKRKEWLELLRKTLEASGPAFIKWGQWAATRHDLFPPDLCSELELLHSQAPAHRFKHTRLALEAAFGMRVDELFQSVEETPLASGSIGQVHRAVLSEKGAAVTGYQPGTTVAIKVRHPGVGSAIIRDFATMLWVAHCAAALPALQHLRLEDTLKQFAAPLREQVDFLREAHNLWRFNHNFRKTRHVTFPVPLYPLVAPDVLVESYEAGRSISHYIASIDNPHNHRLAELGSGTMLQMMLVDNLIHSDLHPGNILVRLEAPSGVLGWAYRAIDEVQRLEWARPLLPPSSDLSAIQRRWLEPRIVLLDVGMATELTGEDRDNMVGLFRSFAGLDGRGVGDWVLRFSGEEQTCPDPEAFKSDMEDQFQALKRPGEVGPDGTFGNGSEVLAAVLEVIRQHQVNLPGHICAVVVTTLVLEGWSCKLDPRHSVLTQVQTMLKPEAVPWRERIGSAVDAWSSEDQLQLV